MVIFPPRFGTLFLCGGARSRSVRVFAVGLLGLKVAVHTQTQIALFILKIVSNIRAQRLPIICTKNYVVFYENNRNNKLFIKC